MGIFSSHPKPSAFERLKNGDEKAQAMFWEDNWKDMYGICSHILGPGPDANDIAVDVLVDFMYRYAQTLSNPKAMHAYLRLMATRRSLRFKEKRMRYKDEELDEKGDDLTEKALEAANCSFLQPKLAECLSQLTPKAQKAVRLRYSKEMTNDKIGGILDCSKQYIGRLIRQSLELLKLCLEKQK
jgi:RNA polymerase sigma factor (sigma-70 family)